jgi:mRNA interferase RelE/StbE
MTYRFVFSEEALSQLRRLDNKTAKRLLDKLESSAENPARFFERLAGREEYKMRVGDYRIIARVLQSEKRVFIMSLGHRKNVYKE